MFARRFSLAILVLTFLGGAFGILPTEALAQSRYQVNGTAIGISGRAGYRSRQFTLIVNRYTTDAQVKVLNEALRDDRQDGFLRALDKLEAGRIALGQGVGVTANAIISEPWGDGGTKLRVFYRRTVTFFELRYGARSEDYKVGYAELFLDKRGRGEGTFFPAARIRLRGENTWEVEDFAVFPARLMGLTTSGRPIR